MEASLTSGTLTGMILAVIAGTAVSGIVLFTLRNKRLVSRAIDLVSFSIAGTGLAASLLAVGTYEKRIRDNIDLLEITQSSVQAVKEIMSIGERACPTGVIKPESKAADCERMQEYYRSLLLVHARGTSLPRPPTTPLPKTNEVMEAFFDIETLVFTQNQKSQEFFFSEIGKSANASVRDEITAIIYAAYVVSFAFGMGIVRRAFDTWIDSSLVTKPSRNKNSANTRSRVSRRN